MIHRKVLNNTGDGYAICGTTICHVDQVQIVAAAERTSRDAAPTIMFKNGQSWFSFAVRDTKWEIAVL